MTRKVRIAAPSNEPTIAPARSPVEYISFGFEDGVGEKVEFPEEPVEELTALVGVEVAVAPWEVVIVG